LIEQLCGILDDCPIDNPYVTKAAAKVKSHLPALRCVRSESRKHELTAVLDELSEKRRRTLISLDMRMKAALWSPLREESEPAAVLRFWFDKQDSRDEQESLNKRSKPGVGNERNTWGIQSKWSKPGVGEGERNKQSKL
jgi:hypothetical protein